MLEDAIENDLVKHVKARGGIAIKLVPWYLRGVPDRLIVLPGPRVIFVELKRPVGGRLSRHQAHWRDKLIALGCEWRLVHTKEQVQCLLNPSTSTS